jgi:hypothetical protein
MDWGQEAYNGDIGFIDNIHSDGGEMTITFDRHPVVCGPGKFDTLSPPPMLPPSTSRRGRNTRPWASQ